MIFGKKDGENNKEKITKKKTGKNVTKK